MDFQLKKGRLLAILGVYLSFFLCGLLLLCVLPWVICFMFGVGVRLFLFVCFVISICTELLCFGRGI